MQHISRKEHIDWAKGRAEEYLDLRRVQESWDSFSSDLQKHPDTANHPALEIGLMSLMLGELSTVQEMREFIQGFN